MFYIRNFKKLSEYIKKYFVDKSDKELLGEFGGMYGLINGRLQK